MAGLPTAVAGPKISTVYPNRSTLVLIALHFICHLVKVIIQSIAEIQSWGSHLQKLLDYSPRDSWCVEESGRCYHVFSFRVTKYREPFAAHKSFVEGVHYWILDRGFQSREFAPWNRSAITERKKPAKTY